MEACRKRRFVFRVIAEAPRTEATRSPASRTTAENVVEGIKVAVPSVVLEQRRERAMEALEVADGGPSMPSTGVSAGP
jgi:hypothetical protein